MHWLKRDMWKASIAVAGLLLFLVLMVWVPMATSAHAGMAGVARAGTFQATPTVDLTVTALAKEQLILQNKQLQQSEDRGFRTWLWNNAAAIVASFLSTLVVVVGALIGFWQWRVNRNDIRTKESNERKEAQDKELRDRAEQRQKEITAQDKELRAQTEERFKTAVAALGSNNEATQVGGAIMLRSFLNTDDKEIYGRYYAQIFDLAVAYLRLTTTLRQQEDPDGFPSSLQNPDIPLPLTPLRQALVIVFKESFPLARERLKRPPSFLDASCIQLDNAHLADTDLRQIWIPEASLRNATLRRSDFSEAALYKANLSHADLKEAILTKTNLYKANLTNADLSSANLSHADLRGADLGRADLTEADLTRADLFAATLGNANLSGANLDETNFCYAWLGGTKLNEANLRGADLRGADLRGADLREVDLRGVDLRGYDQGESYPGRFIPILLEEADFRGADFSGAKFDRTSLSSLKNTDLRGVKGLTKEKLQACKARGAIIDEDTTASPSQSDTAPPPPSLSSDAQALSAAPAQMSAPPPITDGSSATSSQPGAEP